MRYLVCVCASLAYFFFFKQKTAYEMRISDWSSDVCSSDLLQAAIEHRARADATIATGLTNDFNNYRRPHIDVNADADAHMAMLTFKDRKSVVSGTSVSVRVDLGGRRIIKKNNNQ